MARIVTADIALKNQLMHHPESFDWLPHQGKEYSIIDPEQIDYFSYVAINLNVTSIVKQAIRTNIEHYPSDRGDLFRLVQKGGPND